MSKEDDSPECEWSLRFRECGARRNRISCHGGEKMRDCLQVKHSVHELSERT